MYLQRFAVDYDFPEWALKRKMVKRKIYLYKESIGQKIPSTCFFRTGIDPNIVKHLLQGNWSLMIWLMMAWLSWRHLVDLKCFINPHLLANGFLHSGQNRSVPIGMKGMLLFASSKCVDEFDVKSCEAGLLSGCPEPASIMWPWSDDDDEGKCGSCWCTVWMCLISVRLLWNFPRQIGHGCIIFLLSMILDDVPLSSTCPSKMCSRKALASSKFMLHSMQ